MYLCYGIVPGSFPGRLQHESVYRMHVQNGCNKSQCSVCMAIQNATFQMFVNNSHSVQDTSAMCWSVKTFEYYEAVGKRTCAKAWLFHSFSVTSFLIVLNFSKLLYNGKAVELTVNLPYVSCLGWLWSLSHGCVGGTAACNGRCSRQGAVVVVVANAIAGIATFALSRRCWIWFELLLSGMSLEQYVIGNCMDL